MAALLAIGAAVTWSVSDFLGGITTRRTHELVVAALSQLAGVVVVLVALPVTGGTPSVPALAWGALAGLGGAGGLVMYFRALAIGPMGVTAPVAALAGAAVPVAVGLSLGERPGALAVTGIVLGLAATVLASRPAEALPLEVALAADPDRLRRGLAAAIAAGLLFGLFFVALDRTPDESGLWPLLGARMAALPVLAALLLRRRPAGPDRGAVRVAMLSGALDMAANALFLLAVRQGLLVLVSVLTSLYPVGIVLLARVVLGERLGRVQLAGAGLAMAAVVLITL